MTTRQTADFALSIAGPGGQDVHHRSVAPEMLSIGGPASAATSSSEFLEKERTTIVPAIGLNVQHRNVRQRIVIHPLGPFEPPAELLFARR
jgi:hypothetical protein